MAGRWSPGLLADGGGAAHGVVRYSLAEAAVQRLDVHGRTVRWRRSGGSPELSAPPSLFVSANGVTYVPAGTMRPSATPGRRAACRPCRASRSG